MLEVIGKLLSGHSVDHAGEFYSFEGLHMAPSPSRPVEIRIGGLNRVALRRAARHDGWLGLNHAPDEIQGIVSFLDDERKSLGRGDRDFDVMIAHYPAAPEGPNTRDGGEYVQFRDVGVDSVNVPPWRYRGIDSISLDEKRRSLEDFAERYILPLGD